MSAEAPIHQDIYTDYVVSRAVTKHYTTQDSSEVATQLDLDDLTPWELRLQLTDLAGSAAVSGVQAILDASRRDTGKRPESTLTENNAGQWIKRMSRFLESGINDSMAAALSIPPMPRARALGIALSVGSRQSMRQLAAGGNGSLQFPYSGRPRISYFGPEHWLRYDEGAGHIVLFENVEGEGCPVARGRGKLIEKLYALIADVTITNVERPKGTKIYPTSQHEPTPLQQHRFLRKWLYGR